MFLHEPRQPVGSYTSVVSSGDGAGDRSGGHGARNLGKPTLSSRVRKLPLRLGCIDRSHSCRHEWRVCLWRLGFRPVPWRTGLGRAAAVFGSLDLSDRLAWPAGALCGGEGD